MLLNIYKLSDEYEVKGLNECDAEEVLYIQAGNPLYYEHCPPKPSIKNVIKDMRALPPNKTYRDKYYLGFFENDELIAVMDLIAEYTIKQSIFIGFFMIKSEKSNRGIGSGIIQKCLEELKNQGFLEARLGYIKSNPQSAAFWRKCGFLNTGIETDNGQGIMLIMSKKL